MERVALELENAQLKQRLRELEESNREMCEALKESTKLLLKTRPHTRPPIHHERKLLQAAIQKFRCANPYGSCLLHRFGTGLFDESLFECDHVEPFSKSFRSVGNLQAIKSRMERLQSLEEEAEPKEEPTP